MQNQNHYHTIRNSLLEFIPPKNSSCIQDEHFIAYVDTLSQVTFSFLILPSLNSDLGNYNEDTLNEQGFEVIEKYALNCEIDNSGLFLTKNFYMPGIPSEELLAMFYDGENLIMLNCSFQDKGSFEMSKEGLVESFSTIRKIKNGRD